jgi:hypothetical protein
MATYKVKRRLELDGITHHVGRVVELDAAAPGVQILLATAVIEPTTEPKHPSTRPYRVTTLGHQMVIHDGRPRDAGELILLADFDEDVGVGRDVKDGQSSAGRLEAAGYIERA